MSTDGRYILSYESFPYNDPSPQDQDKKLLIEKYPQSEIVDFDYGDTFYFRPRKYTILSDDVDKLLANQIYERIDGDLWKKIK